MTPEHAVPLLLQWFALYARDLPWRHTRDPYAIWVSEIMLQQTQVKTVISFWERWMAALPTIESLARARSAKIHKLWEGLGYYTRVRNMQKAAQLIVGQHAGLFPSHFDEVLALPGIGRYTAGAICSIAFNQPHPVLDGNVIRVLTRVFGIEGNPQERIVSRKLWNLAEQLVQHAAALEGQADPGQTCSKQQVNRGVSPNSQASAPRSKLSRACSQLNQSLMELGALVCTPRQPACTSCPLGKLCIARNTRRVEALPQLPSRASATRRCFVAFVARRGGKFLVRQRADGVVNAHLWEFPNVEVANEDGTSPAAGLQALGARSDLRHVCTIRHSITRFRIRLDVFESPARDLPPTAKTGKWLSRRQLDQLAFASAHKKILRHIKT